MNKPDLNKLAPATAVTTDPWARLQALTTARIALGRSGVSLPTAEVLRFGLAHAQARDAVHLPLDTAALDEECRADGFRTCIVRSCAPDRASYLRRPDWGRQLDEASRTTLQAAGFAAPKLVFVLADGLSSLATRRHSLPLLQALRGWLPALAACPVVIATQARVALGDAVGEALGAEMVAVLIGERPGLSSPDSLGLYLTGSPRIGLTDATRNCISNIRPEGLDYAAAARKLAFLIAGAQQLGRTGVDLKDDSDERLPDARPDASLFSLTP